MNNLNIRIFFILTLVTRLTAAQVIFSSDSKMILHEITRAEHPEHGSFPLVVIRGEKYLSCLVKLAPAFDPSDLPAGFVLGSRNGELATLKVRLDQIGRINELENITHLEVAARVQPDITKAVADLRADTVHMGIGLNTSYSGKNVIIGLTDWGFDYTHPMFYDTTLQNTRIIGVWDQFRNSGIPPSGMTYGTEVTGSASILAMQSDTACTYYDYGTHGTHVAGIAGGGGAGIGLKGVAFESEFLFCQFYLDAGSAIDAVSWMRDIAQSRGKRLVINMSWSLYHLGPLDGSSLFSQALDVFSQDDVVIVVSAGNNGGSDFHIRKDFNQDTLRTRVQFYPYSAHPSMWGQSLHMWGEQGTSFSAGFEIWNGSSFLMETPMFLTDHSDLLDTFIPVGNDTVYYKLNADSAHPQNQVPHMRLRIKNTAGYRIILKAFSDQGRVHFYNLTELSNGAGNWGMPFSFSGSGTSEGDSDYGLGSPACTKEVITVAAHNSQHILPNGTVINGHLASFSSKGPTTDERIKPDVSAPGMNVESSISSFTSGNYNPTSTTTFNGKTYEFDRFSGTSMSAPATTGVVALMLEANPYLSSEQVKAILKSSARQDDRTGVIPTTGHVNWGWGKVTAHHAVKEAENSIHIREFSQPGFVVYPTLVSESLRIEGPNDLNRRMFIISNVQGMSVMKGPVNTEIDVYSLTPGIYFIRISGMEGCRKFIRLSD